MWINKTQYELILQKNNIITQQNAELRKKIEELEDESGISMLKKLKLLAKECGIEQHGDEYQTFMHRMFMAVAGRQSSEAKAYSRAAFLKDNDDELMERMVKLIENGSIVTKKLEQKKIAKKQ